MELLLRAGAKPDARCDGNPPLCMAACLAMLPGKEAPALLILGALLAAKVNPADS